MATHRVRNRVLSIANSNCHPRDTEPLSRVSAHLSRDPAHCGLAGLDDRLVSRLPLPWKAARRQFIQSSCNDVSVSRCHYLRRCVVALYGAWTLYLRARWRRGRQLAARHSGS